MKTMLRNDLRGLLTNSVFVLGVALIPVSASAQSAVTVDMGAIDAAPKLLVPEDRATPVTLRPPPGMKSETSSNSAIKLRPPPSMAKQAPPAPAPKTAVAQKPPQSPAPQKTEVAEAAPPAPKPQPAPATAAKPKETNVAAAAPAPAPNTPKAAVSAPPKPTPITPQVQPAVVAKVPVSTPPAQNPTATESAAAETEPAAVEETQTAALVEPNKPPTPPDEFTILYGIGNADVPNTANDNLKLLAARMVKNSDLRVEFIAFASDAEESVSRSRRLSLERAVNVRKMLLDAGVDSSRVTLRALGEQSGDGEPDRIDVIVTTR